MVNLAEGAFSGHLPRPNGGRRQLPVFAHAVYREDDVLMDLLMHG